MNGDSTPKNELSSTPGTGREFAARRKIIKGMASTVPVVMTIGCGQAMAQTSLSCVVKTPPPAGLEECVDKHGISLDPSGYGKEADGYLRYQTTKAACGEPTGPNEQWRLLYVDQDGGSGGSGSYPVTSSCYSSFV